MSSDHNAEWQELYSSMLFWEYDGILREEQYRSHAGFIERVLNLKPGDRVLDLGSGLGGLPIELARKGYEVTGLEWSKVYIEEARQRARRANVEVRFLPGDMIHMEFDGEFDAVTLMRNTFGIFSHEDNLSTRIGIRKALKKGGQALLGTQNEKGLPGNLEKGWDFENEGQRLVLTRGTRDTRNARFGFEVIYVDLRTGERHRLPYSWRLYLLPELKLIFEEIGLALLGVYGDDPEVADWKNWRSGEPWPYTTEAFTEKAAVRNMVLRAG